MPPAVIDAPERSRVSKSRYRRWTWRRQLVASGLRLTAATALGLMLWGAWYLANRGFGRQWRTTVVEELRKRGVEASVRRLTLDPFRGLVAQDVRIFDFKNRDKPLAEISEVSLDINYAALLHRQPFLNAIDVRDAEVTFPNPSGNPNEPRAQLTQFRAHVYFPPEQIFISQAEGVFCGVRISASGQLIKRNDYRPSRVVSEEEWKLRMQLLQRVAAQLQAFRFIGGPPSLQVKFTGDLAEMENSHVEATLRGERMQRGNYEIKQCALAGEWIARKLNITRLEWTDATGDFSGGGMWNAATNAVQFQAHSSVDVKALLDAFDYGEPLVDFTFAAPPEVELSGSANFADPTPRFSVIGRVTLDEFTYRTLPLLSLATDFAWDEQRMMLREVRVRDATGELLAAVLDAPGDFRLNLESSVNPAAIRPLVSDNLRKFLGEWEWTRSPAVRLTIRGASRNPETWTGDGTIAVQRTRFRGVWMNSASANVHFAEGAVAFRDLRVTREEGIGTGSFTYDYKRHEVRLEHVQTSLRPTEAIYWIDPDLLKVVVPYKFRQPPKLTANGVVKFHGGRNTHLTIGIEAPTGMDYVFLEKTLPFDRVRGEVLITDDRVQLRELEGGLFDGQVKASADISTVKRNQHYSAALSVSGVDFPRLTDLYFDYETARGQLSGTYEWSVQRDDTRTMRGAGEIKVANGDVFAIPIFGPLSGLVAAIIPGGGYSVAKQATASFTIADGVIHTDDFKVSGKLFGMLGHGDIHFLDNKLDFDVRIQASGPGVVLTPVYKLFEYKGDGPLSKPNWHPKRF